MHTSPSILAKAMWCCFHGALAAAVLATLSVATGTPFLFPALGGSIFLISWAPHTPAASPRNVILGHTIAACVGWMSVQAFHIQAPGGTLVYNSTAQIGSMACALGVASALMVLLRAPHGPAGATTLIVSSGLMPRFEHIPIVVTGAAAVCVVAWCAHRLRGVPFPMWAAQPAREEAY